jgi:SurA N-terminal domain
MARNSARFLAVAIVAATLAACGATLEPPAAVVDGHLISQSQLAERVREALTVPTTAREVAQAGSTGRRELTSEVLDRLVEVALVRGYAHGHGIGVTATDVSNALRQLQDQFGGAAAYARVLRARGLTVTQVRAIIEENLLIQKVQQSLAAGGTSGATQNSQAIYGEWLKERAQTATIRINPRFGAFDRSRGFVVPLDSTALLPG